MGKKLAKTPSKFDRMLDQAAFGDDTNTQQGGITGSTLKIIAMVIMLIDHIGASVMERYLVHIGFFDLPYEAYTAPENARAFSICIAYWIMRLIGRIAFPIFCFLLVEGFLKTSNLFKYATRLLVFSLISEIPFDMAFHGHVLEFSSQNVFFTLFIGLATITAIERFLDFMNAHASERVKFTLTGIPVLLISMVGIFISFALSTDYSGIGVLLIIIFYLSQKKVSKLWASLGVASALTLWNAVEVTAFVSVPLISKYNGKRGISLKYIFYVFYPAHLLILALICKAMGI